MANLKFSSEILDDALFRAGENTDGTSDFDAQGLVYLNRAYRAIYMGGGEFDPHINVAWWWLKAENSLILEPSIEGGTVSVTNNSTSVTFSATPSPLIDTDVSNWYFAVDNFADVFKISSITGANGTLDTIYTGDTDSAASYRLFKLEYDLQSDVLALLSPMQGYQDSRHKIQGTSMRMMEDFWPLWRIKVGMPTRFAPTDLDTVRFNRYVEDDPARIDYDYLQRPADLTDSGSEEPLIPLQYRHVLADATAFFLLRDKDDDRASGMINQVRAGIKSMSRENRNRWSRMGEPGQIVPRLRQAYPRYEDLPRTVGGLYLQ